MYLYPKTIAIILELQIFDKTGGLDNSMAYKKFKNLRI